MTRLLGGLATGVRSTRSSAAIRDLVEDPDFPTVRRWREAGGKVVGPLPGVLSRGDRACRRAAAGEGARRADRHAPGRGALRLVSLLDREDVARAGAQRAARRSTCSSRTRSATRRATSRPSSGATCRIPARSCTCRRTPTRRTPATYLRARVPTALARTIEAIDGARPITDEALRRVDRGLQREPPPAAPALRDQARAPLARLAEDAYVARRHRRRDHARGAQRAARRRAAARSRRAPSRPQDRLRVVFEGGFCEQPPLDLLRTIGQSCYVVDDDLLIGLRWIESDVAGRRRPAGRRSPHAYLEQSSYSPVQHDLRKPKERMLLERIRRVRRRGRDHRRRQDVRAGARRAGGLRRGRSTRRGIPYFVSEFEEIDDQLRAAADPARDVRRERDVRLSGFRSGLTTDMSESDGIVGRGMTAGARALPRVVRAARGVGRRAASRSAYVFVMGSLVELLRDVRSAGQLSRDQLAADRGAARRARVPERGRGLRLLARHLRLRQGRRRAAAPQGRAPDGHAAAARARRAHQRVQHLHQVGRDLGAAVPRSRCSRSTSRARAPTARRRSPASRTSRRDRAYVAAQLARADRALRAGERPALRHRPAARVARPRQRDEPRVAPRPRAEPQPRRPCSARSTEGTVYLGVSNAFRGTAEGRALLHRPRRGDGIQGGARHRHDRPTSATGCSSSACRAIRSSAASPRCSPSGAACSSTRPTCGSPRAAPTCGYQYDLADPLASLAEGVLLGVRHAMDSMFFQDRALGRADRAVRRRRRRVPPDQELPHRLDRAGRQRAAR